MSTTQVRSVNEGGAATVGSLGTNREVIVIRVSDVERAKVFHEGAPGARFQPVGTDDRVSGPAPDRRSYSSYASFSDPEDPDWPDWYAEYMVREQAGEELPS